MSKALVAAAKEARKKLSLLESITLKNITIAPEKEKYLPKNLQEAESGLIEECTEVIKAITKAQRFGWQDKHPRKNKTNIELLEEELNDVKRAAAVLHYFFHIEDK